MGIRTTIFIGLFLAAVSSAGEERGPDLTIEGASGSTNTVLLAQDQAGHEGHAGDEAQTAAPDPSHVMSTDRWLFPSDMRDMAGMKPRDPMAAMDMPGWRWMSMGIVRGQYNRQGGPSGDDVVESTNWSMVMGQRDLVGGRLTVMMMNALEPATLRGGGTPQLFQTGETFEGRLLVDRQHAHDFVMNLSATYRRPMGQDGAWWLQLAPRGEPALGPTAFMHRASAGENPAAILSHHYHDATHITDSVVTAGVGWRRAAIEASAFHGEEPDEGRWDIDPGPLDSVSGRLWVWLPGRWSAQASYGFLESPEALEDGDVKRATVSLHYGAAGDGPFAASLVAGRNAEGHGTFYGYVVEAAYKATRRDELFLRAEQVDRDRHLLEDKGRGQEVGGETDDIVEVRALTLGYVRSLKEWLGVRALGDVNVGLGADVTAYDVPSGLAAVYGDAPMSVHGFLRARWGRPHGGDHAMAHP